MELLQRGEQELEEEEEEEEGHWMVEALGGEGEVIHGG